MDVDKPRRGEVYLADLDPLVGSEQAGRRPFLVLSIGAVNRAPVDLAIGIPLTTTSRSSKLYIRIEPAASGLHHVSYAMPEMVRSVSTLRFRKLVGQLPKDLVETASARTGLLIGLGRNRL